MSRKHLWVLPWCFSVGEALAEEFEISLPVSCQIGIECFVQNYPDASPGVAAADYTCGAETYDGHSGTDIRLLSTGSSAAGTAVLASASGKVKAVRDGMPDQLQTINDSTQGRECGNGVLIEHANGWDTQYCHLRSGSVAVSVGEYIARGKHIGSIGYSGSTEFAHIHFSVRKSGVDIDPFTGVELSRGCGLEADGALWDNTARRVLSYKAGEIIEVGFSGQPVDARMLETREADTIEPAEKDGRALFFFGRAINLREGDRQELTLLGPRGKIAEFEVEPLGRNKAQYVAYVGKRSPPGGWPEGTYVGTVQIFREGVELLSRASELKF